MMLICFDWSIRDRNTTKRSHDFWKELNERYKIMEIVYQAYASIRLHRKTLGETEGLRDHIAALQKSKADSGAAGGSFSAIYWKHLIISSFPFDERWTLLRAIINLMDNPEVMLRTLRSPSAQTMHEEASERSLR